MMLLKLLGRHNLYPAPMHMSCHRDCGSMHSLHRSMPDGVPELSGEVDTCPILQKLFLFYNCSQMKNYFVPMESHKKLIMQVPCSAVNGQHKMNQWHFGSLFVS